MNCAHCQQEIPSSDNVCPHCQNAVDAVEIEAEIIEADETNPYAAPVTNSSQTPPPLISSHDAGDSTGGLIPYKNPKALMAYYLGLFSGFPLIGFPIAIAAFILGILGLRDRKKNPVIKGSVHAWIGIGCGGLFTLLWGFIIVALIVATISGM